MYILNIAIFYSSMFLYKSKRDKTKPHERQLRREITPHKRQRITEKNKILKNIERGLLWLEF